MQGTASLPMPWDTPKSPRPPTAPESRYIQSRRRCGW
eukprot:SM000398S15211  [mRNA]  locus=s398:43374:43637:+ [translate_table: standard]